MPASLRALAALFACLIATASPAWAQPAPSPEPTAVELSLQWYKSSFVGDRKLPEPPARFCTQREKTGFILLIAQIETDITTARRNGDDPAALNDYAARLNQLKSRIAFQPVADCGKKDPDIGEVGPGFSSGLPAQFCTAKEKADYVAATSRRIADLESQLTTRHYRLHQILRNPVLGPNSPEAAKVRGQVTRRTAELVVLHDALRRANDMPISNCNDPAPPAETGVVPGGGGGQPPATEPPAPSPAPPKDKEHGMAPSNPFGIPATGFAASFDLGAARTRLPVIAFLGREAPGATAPTLGLIKAPDGGTTFAWSIGGVAGFSPSASGGFDGGIRVAQADWDGDGFVDRVELNGDRLVIPGTGAGTSPNGFVLNYFSGLNTLFEGGTRRVYDSTTVEGQIGWRTVDDGAAYRVALAVGYGQDTHETTFNARVPGFARDIAYRQTIDATYWSIGAVAQGEFVIDGPWSAGGGVRLLYRDGEFEGSNMLSFTGFADARVEGKSEESGIEAGGEVFVSYDVTPTLRITGFGAYTYQDAIPLWETPGGGAIARIVTDSADTWSAGISFTLGF